MDDLIEEEEEEDEENIYFSARDLSQIRNAIFHLLKNFLRLLSKFSLKEKPQCVQTCIEVRENSHNLGVISQGIDGG
jgi:condensin-2 complex subunit D3